MPRTWVLKLAALVMLALVPESVCATANGAVGAAIAPKAVAHFIDVGQGASTLFEFPCGAILIDTGGSDQAHVDSLKAYLKSFFQHRTDLNGTLHTVFITHPHLDHTRGLEMVLGNFTVLNYVDDGLTGSSGGPQVRWARVHDEDPGHKYRVRPVLESEITGTGGLTDAAIDGIKCAKCDPQIHILSAQYKLDPGWGKTAFKEPNDQSLVIRVDFGSASFLITGDLEVPAIKTLVARYKSTSALNVGVWEVGHHGSDNGTTPELLAALSPKIAVIEVGKWNDGKGSSGEFNTWKYGHPRLTTIESLEQSVTNSRPHAVKEKVFTAPETTVEHTVKHAIYATGWDGTVRIQADLDGTLTVL